MESVMSSPKNVIDQFLHGLSAEASARGNALRRTFSFRRPDNGWLRWFLKKLLIISLIAARGWVYIAVIVVLVSWFIYDQSPTQLLESWKSMRGQ